MNFLFPEIDFASQRLRATSAMAGNRMRGAIGTAVGDDLDLNDPQQNLMAMLKIRGDISGEDFCFGFPGEAWAMVPGEGNFKMFKTFGVGAGHLGCSDHVGTEAVIKILAEAARTHLAG